MTTTSRHRTHTYSLGVNCCNQGLNEQQANDVIRQFARVLHPNALDDFWDGYYSTTMQCDLGDEQPFIPTDIEMPQHEGVWR
jgi:hypothetical protein